MFVSIFVKPFGQHHFTSAYVDIYEALTRACGSLSEALLDGGRQERDSQVGRDRLNRPTSLAAVTQGWRSSRLRPVEPAAADLRLPAQRTSVAPRGAGAFSVALG